MPTTSNDYSDDEQSDAATDTEGGEESWSEISDKSHAYLVTLLR